MNPAKLVSVVMLVSLTLGAGLEVNRAHLAAVWKNYGLLGRAFLANFVIVPILGVLFVRAFALEQDVATGVLLMAIAPGVPFVIMGVRKKGGSLGLAVTLALLFPLLSIITIPITAALVLPAAAQAELPLRQFIVTLLAFQLLPVLLGVVIADRLPAIAAKLEGPLRVLFLVTLVVLLAFLFPRIVHDVGTVYGSRGMLASLCIVVLSGLAGWLFGGPDAADRRTLSTGTALRNIGLCALIATVSFTDRPFVAAVVLVYFIVQVIVTTVFGAYLKRTAERAATT
jgi:bile acid:Na+ symporter, BASS family